ncbi:hypothetical protein CHRYSEO8AT_310004 [Chryseobacterium sp. 8AT]|nr:hypothetical protein CHRYSEO8AT_310004 [Chryseobacterium sp. 8AT]
MILATLAIHTPRNSLFIAGRFTLNSSLTGIAAMGGTNLGFGVLIVLFDILFFTFGVFSLTAHEVLKEANIPNMPINFILEIFIYDSKKGFLNC